MSDTESNRASQQTPWFFRQRKYLPVPLALAGLWDVVRHGHPWPPGTWPRTIFDLTAWSLIVLGEAIRIWGVGYIGRKSRSSDIHAARLVTAGPYAHTRNPLYFGGFLLTLGLSVLTGSALVVAGCLAYWVAIYRPIIRAEERFLRQAFGRRYAAYCRAIPRWWPRLLPGPGGRRARWRWQELSKEYQTVAAIIVTAVLVNASLFGSDWLNRRLIRRQLAHHAARQQSPERTSGLKLGPVTPSLNGLDRKAERAQKSCILGVEHRRGPAFSRPPSRC